MATMDDDDDDDEPVPDSDVEQVDDTPPVPLSPVPGLGTQASPLDLTDEADADDADASPDDAERVPGDVPSSPALDARSSPPGAPVNATDSDLWSCVACTFLNKREADKCEICERSRPTPAPARVDPIEAGPIETTRLKASRSQPSPTPGHRGTAGKQVGGNGRRRRLVDSDEDDEPDEPAAARRPASTSSGRRRASRSIDGGGTVGGRRVRASQMPRATTITPRSSGGRGPTRGALPLVDSGGGGGGERQKEQTARGGERQ
jgi:hypothetical protein